MIAITKIESFEKTRPSRLAVAPAEKHQDDQDVLYYYDEAGDGKRVAKVRKEVCPRTSSTGFVPNI